MTRWLTEDELREAVKRSVDQMKWCHYCGGRWITNDENCPRCGDKLENEDDK
jgi:rRNA maturation endonuclease Nob1